MKLRLTIICQNESHESHESRESQTKSSDVIIDAQPTTTIGEIASHIKYNVPSEIINSFGSILYPTLAIMKCDGNDERLWQKTIMQASLKLRDSPILEGDTLTIVSHIFDEKSLYSNEIFGSLQDLQTGIVYPLYEHNVLGRTSSADIFIDNFIISRAHCEITIAKDNFKTLVVNDLGSKNGVTHSENTCEISVSNYKFIYEIFQSTKPSNLNPSNLQKRQINRNYIIPNYLEKNDFTTPKKEEISKQQPLNIIGIIMPVCMGAVFYLIMPNPMTAIFMMMSPIMTLSTWFFQKRSRKRETKTKEAEYASKMSDFKKSIIERVNCEKTTLEMRFPCINATNIWQKHKDDVDFTKILIGRSDLKSLFTVDKVHSMLDNVPFTLDLQTGICITDVSDNVENALLLWILIMYSPFDVEIGIIANSSSNLIRYQYLKWSKHLNDKLVSFDEKTQALMLKNLLQIIELRSNKDRGGVNNNDKTLILLVLGIFENNYALFEQIVNLGKAVNIYTIMFNNLGENIASYQLKSLIFKNSLGQITSTMRGNQISEINNLGEIGSIDYSECEETLKRMLNYSDLSEIVTKNANIPTVARFEDLVSFEILHNDHHILASWIKNNDILGCVIGISAEEKFYINLRKNGPHALVGGTTGAGKSEFLQNWICALALSNSPWQVNFLLVDYKGGSAFSKCNAFPHTVGMITDLDNHLTSRVIRSLHSELVRREHILANANVKDIIEYEKILQKNRWRQNQNNRLENSITTPKYINLSNLVIIIDEFAALAKELPEFVDEIVDIAARGRSLGIHLIMATQRPSGVIKDNIKANTNLRIALRVSDISESREIIGTDFAVNIDRKTPGRFFAKIDNNSLVEVQSGYVGYIPSNEKRDIKVSSFDLHEKIEFDNSNILSKSYETSEMSETFLEQFTKTLQYAYLSSHNTDLNTLEFGDIFKPWCEPLPELIMFDKMSGFGLLDLVDLQKQEILQFNNLMKNNILITGASKSGKTSIIETFIANIYQNTSSYDLYYNYIIDCSNADMTFADCGFVQKITIEQTEVLWRLMQFIIDNAKQSKKRNIKLFIDRIDIFKDALEDSKLYTIAKLFGKIISNSNAYNVQIIATQGRVGGIYQNWQGFLNTKIWLKLNNESEYNLAGLDLKNININAKNGRGYIHHEDINNNELCEVQFAKVDSVFWNEIIQKEHPKICEFIKELPQILPTSSDYYALSGSDLTKISEITNKIVIIGDKKSDRAKIASNISQFIKINKHIELKNFDDLCNLSDDELKVTFTKNGIFLIDTDNLRNNWSLNSIIRSQIGHDGFTHILLNMNASDASNIANVDFPMHQYIEKTPNRGYLIQNEQIILAQF